jgi:uncharacterized protein (TIGR00369 family)
VPGPDETRDRFGQLLGLSYQERGPELVRARIRVTERLFHPYDAVHGGVMTAMAESMCSHATLDAVIDDGKVAMGQSTHTTFLRPVRAGHLNATARRRHGGRTAWVWDAEVADDEGRVCALVRLVIAVRDARRAPAG